MPIPAQQLATLRPDLATFQEFDLEMDRRGFIATQVAPVIEVGQQSGTFGKIPLEQLLQNRETRRAPGSGYARGNWKFEPASYATEEHGAEEPVDERESKIYANYFDAEQVAASRAYDVVLRNAERRMADKIFDPVTWTGSALTTGVSEEWDDYENATPDLDIEEAVQLVYANSGLWPNALVVNRKVFRNLRLCEKLWDRFRAQGFVDVRPGNITAQQLAAVFDLEYVIVAGSSKNTAAEGQAASLASIWSDEYAMVCRVATSNDMREPCIARTFHWSADGSQIGGTIETYYEEQTRSQIVRVRHEVAEMVLYPEMGHLLSNITT